MSSTTQGDSDIIEQEPSPELKPRLMALASALQRLGLKEFSSDALYVTSSIKNYEGYPEYKFKNPYQDEDDKREYLEGKAHWSILIETQETGTPQLNLVIRFFLHDRDELDNIFPYLHQLDSETNYSYQNGYMGLEIKASLDPTADLYAEITTICRKLSEVVYGQADVPADFYTTKATEIYAQLSTVTDQIIDFTGSGESLEELADKMAAGHLDIKNAFEVKGSKDESFPIIKPETVARYYLLRSLTREGYSVLSLEQQAFFREQILDITKEFLAALMYLNVTGDWNSILDPHGLLAEKLRGEDLSWEEVVAIHKDLRPLLQEHIAEISKMRYYREDGPLGWDVISLVNLWLGDELTNTQVPLVRRLVTFADIFTDLTHSGNEASTIPQRLTGFDPNALLIYALHDTEYPDNLEMAVLWERLTTQTQSAIKDYFPDFNAIDFNGLNMFKMLFASNTPEQVYALLRNLSSGQLKYVGTNGRQLDFQISPEWQELISYFSKLILFLPYHGQTGKTTILTQQEVDSLTMPILVELTYLYPGLSVEFSQVVQNSIAHPDTSRGALSYDDKQIRDYLVDSQSKQKSSFDSYQVITVPDSKSEIILIKVNGQQVQIYYDPSDETIPPLVYIDNRQVAQLTRLSDVLMEVRAVGSKYRDGD